MILQENIRRILKEESLKQTLIDEMKRSGIRDTAKLMSITSKELLKMAGFKESHNKFIKDTKLPEIKKK
jgi:hypothetical protein